MDNVKTGKALVRVEEHEGSLLYSDVAGRDGVRALGVLALVVYHDPRTNLLQLGSHTMGYQAALAEALAGYYLMTPGFKDAVDGMYNFRAKVHGGVERR